MPLTARGRLLRIVLVVGLGGLLVWGAVQALPWICREEIYHMTPFSLEQRLRDLEPSGSGKSGMSSRILHTRIIRNRCTGDINSYHVWYRNGFIAEAAVRTEQGEVMWLADDTGRTVEAMLITDGQIRWIDRSSVPWPPDQTGPTAPWIELGLSPREWWSRIHGE